MAEEERETDSPSGGANSPTPEKKPSAFKRWYNAVGFAMAGAALGGLITWLATMDADTGWTVGLVAFVPLLPLGHTKWGQKIGSWISDWGHYFNWH